MNLTQGLGTPAATRSPSFMDPIIGSVSASSFKKLAGLRYAQDITHFIDQALARGI